MESLSPAVASAMAATGSSASMVTPSCRVFYSTSSRSMFVTGSPLQVQSTRPPSCISRSLNFIHAAVASAPQKTDEVEDERALKRDENTSIAPNSFEVHSLLMEVCDETSIAELELKVGAFELHVKRDVGKLKSSAAAVSVAPPVPSMPMVESAAPSISPPVTSSPAQKTPSVSVLTSLTSKSGSKVKLLEAGADEGLHFVTAPKVGLFRRSRVVKGKSGRPLCEEGQIVKQGQVVCYVEQLGTQQPVEAENSGEVVKILCKDGEPVGYGDPLIAIRPSFQGIK